MDYDEPRSASNEKMQPIQWTEWPTGALVATGSLWPWYNTHTHTHKNKQQQQGLNNYYYFHHS